MKIVRTAGAVALIILCASMPQGQAHVARIVPGIDVTPAAVGQVVVADLNHYAPSPPLEEILVVEQQQEEEADLARPLPAASASAAGDDDPVVQTSAGQPVDTVDLGSFNGLGHTGSAPSDANGAAGNTQYVQWVNSKIGVFNKLTGELQYANIGRALFQDSDNGPCQINGDHGSDDYDQLASGDGVVLYDRYAGKWLISQWPLPKSTSGPSRHAHAPGDKEGGLRTVCLAVSNGADAKTSTYNRYSFDVSGVLPANTTLDYPKFGIWPDGYYYTANIFDANSTVVGTSFCAFERAAMLQNADARAQCVFIDGGLASYLPADLDGPNPPPDGSPDFLLDVGHPDSGQSSNELRLRRFQVNWIHTENSTLTDPVVINVAPFIPALMPAYPVPQLSPGTPLEAIGDRPMFRLAYRNFGDHESLVMNHTVVVDGRHGVRWYELRPNQNPVVYQQGTYAPGNVSRWVASIAMDSAGDIAIGYSASSNGIHPAIRYTGRVPGDPSGTLDGERSIVEGGGSETVPPDRRARWGDYSSLTLDPDDCTFWYTNQYLQTNGDSTNWDTKISRFTFRACGSARSAAVAVRQKELSK